MSAASIDGCFDALAAAALDGQRCPLNDQLPGGSESVRRLARAGKIRIEVGFHNWRVVKILTGPAKGQSTALPSTGPAWRPYVIIGREGREVMRRRSIAR